MATHEELWKVCRDTEAYRQGTDTKQHELPDCSCGCRFFHSLEGEAGNDWGCLLLPEITACRPSDFRTHGLQLLGGGMTRLAKAVDNGNLNDTIQTDKGMTWH
jgi:hypothetical protein